MTRWSEINCPRCAELEAKLAQQADLVQAAVAAALTEAADAVTEWLEEYPWHASLAQDILALITPDAQAALDRVVVAERERCINLAATWSKDAAATIREGAE